MIEYKEFRSELIEEICRIYQENQWRNYLGDKDKLSRAFERSLYVLGAFDEGNLVGFMRCVGDSEYILYVQDLIVKPTHYRQGIRKALILCLVVTTFLYAVLADERDNKSRATLAPNDAELASRLCFSHTNLPIFRSTPRPTQR